MYTIILKTVQEETPTTFLHGYSTYDNQNKLIILGN